MFSSSVASLYEKLTGESAKFGEIYDLQFTLDSRHQDIPYSAYIGISESGNLIYKNITFGKDRLQIGKITWTGFKPLVDIDMGNYSYANYSQIETFKEARDMNKIIASS